MTTFGDALQGVFQNIRDLHDRKKHLMGIPTGFHEIDDLTGGLQPGHLYVVAGRPSMGKTSLVMNISEHVALAKRKVLFFSTEMKAQRLANSILCSHARIDASLLGTGRLNSEDFQRLAMAAGAFNEAEIHIIDRTRPSLKDVFALTREENDRSRIDLIVVDYMNTMNIAPDLWSPDTRYPEVTRISSGLKALSKEFDVPVVVVAQLNRDTERREYRRPPYMWDLRDSGAIEEDADVVMMLYREDYYQPDTEKRGVLEIHIVKNRTGPIGSVDVAFIKQYMRVENLAASRPS